MRQWRLFWLALSLILSGAVVTATPAAAEQARLEQSTSTTVTPFGAGYLVGVHCEVDVVNHMPDEVPLSTTVHCTVNGASATHTQPGPHADVAVVTATGAPIVVCISGSATILDLSPLVSYMLTAPSQCHVISP